MYYNLTSVFQSHLQVIFMDQNLWQIVHSTSTVLEKFPMEKFKDQRTLKKKQTKQWTITYLGHQNTFINKELLGKSYHNFS